MSLTRFGILCCTFQLYDVCVSQKPRTDHPTVLDMMEITDLEVRNVLIDQCQVDTVLLIEKRLDAEQVIEVERPRGASVVSILECCGLESDSFLQSEMTALSLV